ncbi:MAG: hypothetical protein ACTHKM_07185 [Tsuneonella sp.]
MTTKTKLLATALLASLTLGAAAPASAAQWGAPAQLRQDISQLDRQIDRARDQRRISRAEAAQLDRQVDRLQNTYRAYARGGFTRGEYAALDRGVDAVRRNLAVQVRDGDRFAGRDGRYHRGWTAHR